VIVGDCSSLPPDRTTSPSFFFLPTQFAHHMTLTALLLAAAVAALPCAPLAQAQSVNDWWIISQGAARFSGAAL
jgi:hypothetical protein